MGKDIVDFVGFQFERRHDGVVGDDDAFRKRLLEMLDRVAAGDVPKRRGDDHWAVAYGADGVAAAAPLLSQPLAPHQRDLQVRRRTRQPGRRISEQQQQRDEPGHDDQFFDRWAQKARVTPKVTKTTLI